MTTPGGFLRRCGLTATLAAKGRAFLLHLLSTTLLVGGVLALAVSRWFPLPYFFADGGWQGLRLVLAADLVLGPLLSLVVFHPAKRWSALLLDYTVIALLQVAALGLGLFTVFSHRTVMVVFADGAFYSVDAETAQRAGGKVPELLATAASRPAYLAIRMPADPEGRQRLRRDSLMHGRPLILLGDRAETLASAASAEGGLGGGVDVAACAAQNEGCRRELERFLRGRNASVVDYAFYPLSCRYRSLTLALRRDSGAVAGFLRLSFGPGGKPVADPAGR